MSKEIYKEEIIFKTTITEELNNSNKRAIRNILGVVELFVDKEKYPDVRKFILDELNDYHRRVCEVFVKLFDEGK